jgi:7-carboxy-7-deazaguanine synthase
VQRVFHYNPFLVEITGGEPLLQKETPALAQSLLDKVLTVLVETNGSLDIELLPSACHRIIDIKTPGSNQCDKNNFANLQAVGEKDEIKFVIASRKDYEWSKEIMTQYELSDRCKVLLSPAHGYIESEKVAQWILKDNLHVRLQPQLHKLLWPQDFKERDRHE